MFALAIPWPAFLALIAGLCLASNLLFVAITSGLAFARFARSNACIRPARWGAFLAMDEISREGHRPRRLKPLVLQRDEGAAFDRIRPCPLRCWQLSRGAPLKGSFLLRLEIVLRASSGQATRFRSWKRDRAQGG